MMDGLRLCLESLDSCAICSLCEIEHVRSRCNSPIFAQRGFLSATFRGRQNCTQQQCCRVQCFVFFLLYFVVCLMSCATAVGECNFLLTGTVGAGSWPINPCGRPDLDAMLMACMVQSSKGHGDVEGGITSIWPVYQACEGHHQRVLLCSRNPHLGTQLSEHVLCARHETRSCDPSQYRGFRLKTKG